MSVTIRTKQATYEIPCEAGERVLYAALRAAVPMPFECASGTCGTCKARVKTGQVTELWPEAPGRSYLKPERGEILMCQCALAGEGDLEILVPGAAPSPPEPTPAHREGVLTAGERLTHDVARFSVDLDAPIDFSPGQFVLLQIPALEGYRAYSMVNHAEGPTRLEFVVKQKPGGGFSRWLFDAEAGQTPVGIFGPLGRATFSAAENKDVLCIAGGSGVAGMMSILTAASGADYFARHRGRVFFGVRTLNDVFFRRELADLVERAGPNLQVTIALSEQEAPAGDGAIRFATGFVHQVAGEAMAGRYEGSIAYVAGPPPMVDGAIRLLIIEGRLPASDIRYDKFG